MDDAYRLLLKGTQFPEDGSAHYLTTLDMLSWPEPDRVIPVEDTALASDHAIALLSDVEQRHIRDRTKQLQDAAKTLRIRNASRFIDRYLAVARRRVWRRFTDDLSDRIYHQRWDFLDCFRLLARSEWQIAVLYACTIAYRHGFSVAEMAARAQDRLEAAHRGQVVPLSRGRAHRSGERLA